MLCSVPLALCTVLSAAAFPPHLNGHVLTDPAALERFADTHIRWLHERRPPRFQALSRSIEIPQAQLNASRAIRLIYIDARGLPVFYRTCNLDAAGAIRTDAVWPGGGGGFSLDGSSTASGELGVWDFGGVYEYHVEFQGRVTLLDEPPFYYAHATLVAGTMVAAGIDPQAKGMSFAARLAAYDMEEDLAEMAAAAASGMKVSNHSYGVLGGWDYVNVDGLAYPAWFGDISVDTAEDYRFGFYGELSRQWDELAYLAPCYSIVVAAGNDRDDVGPGEGHYAWDGGEWVWSTEQRDPDGGAGGFDCITPPATAKNVITVGAVEDMPDGYAAPPDVAMSPFSSWGPVDDGRIKPDIVANGVDVYSTSSYLSDEYNRASGTSFAAPSVAGSLNLLVQHFEATHGGTTPRAATVKALMIQTADEAGPAPGPDYMFGWGLMNTLAAAQLIEADKTAGGYIRENRLQDGSSHEYYIDSDGMAPLRVTMAWTDPPGVPPDPGLNPRIPILVNDLDLRLEHIETAFVYRPAVLDPDNPADPAYTGDNNMDNTERIDIEIPSAGRYRIRVTHKGALHGSAQDYSLVTSSPISDPSGDHRAFRLHQNYPNPLQAATLIEYEIPCESFVKLRILDVAGRCVRTLVSEKRDAGAHTVYWDGTDARGGAVVSGIYLYHLETGPFEATRKILLLH